MPQRTEVHTPTDNFTMRPGRRGIGRAMREKPTTSEETQLLIATAKPDRQTLLLDEINPEPTLAVGGRAGDFKFHR